jgi:hypothetical protein
MVREGYFRQNKKHADGTIRGTLHYGLLRSEFLEKKQGSAAKWSVLRNDLSRPVTPVILFPSCYARDRRNSRCGRC